MQLNMDTRAWRIAGLTLVALAICGCPPTATMTSIVGRWDVSSVGTSPPEFVGTVDAFQIDLFPTRTGEGVPGSGYDIGVDIEITSDPVITYTFNGQSARVNANWGVRIEGVEFFVVSVFNLEVVEYGVMEGTRNFTVWSGVTSVSGEYDESWLLISKSSQPQAPMSSVPPHVDLWFDDDRDNSSEVRDPITEYERLAPLLRIPTTH